LMLYVLVTSNMVGANTREEKYEDLIYASMQSIVSLNNLVTDLGVQVTRLTTEMAEVKMSLEKTKQELNSNLLDETEKLDEKIEYLAVEIVSPINEEVAALGTSVVEIEATIDTMGSEVMIVSGEQAAGDEKCRKVCAGSTGRENTDWYHWQSEEIYYDVDISDCGFITVPTVTTSIEGNANLVSVVGATNLWNTSPSSFRVILQHLSSSKNLQGGFAESRDWNIDWIAVGYTC